MAEIRPPSGVRRTLRLPVRLVAVAVLPALATAAVLIAISVRTTLAFQRAQIQRSYPLLLERGADRLAGWLEEGKADLLQLAADPALAALREDGDRDASSWLSHVLRNSRFFEALIVTSGDGQPRFQAGTADLLPARESVPEESASKRSHLWAASADGSSSPLIASARVDVPGVRDAFLHGVFRRSALEAQLRADGPSGSRGLCLVDASGRLRPDACPGGVAGRVPRALPIALTELASGEVREYDGLSGDRVLGAARPLGVLGWHLLVEEPIAEALAPVHTLVQHAIAAEAVLLLLLTWFALRMASDLAAPIEATAAAARRVAAGDLDVELPTSVGAPELARLTEAFRAMAQSLREQQQRAVGQTNRLTQQNEDLQRANEVLEQLSITDGLTRLHNHRFFQDHLTREIKRVSRTHEPLSMLVIDLDDFKRLNDRQGHKAGDELLQNLARILDESIRENDLVARYGGEEFVVVAPFTDLHGAVALAEKIRMAVAESSFILGDSKQITKVTISIGVAQYKGNRRAFFQAADQALYRAKGAGKNCVVSEDA